MKRILALILLTGLLAACLGGCGSVNLLQKRLEEMRNERNSSIPFSTTQTQPSAVPTESIPPQTQGLVTVEKENLIIESISVDREVDGVSYSFHVPQINFSTPDFAYVNQEIMAVFGTVAQEALEAAEEGYSTGCYAVGWKICWYEDIFALILYRCFDGDNTYYEVYNFDYTTGEQFDMIGFLSRLGLSEGEFYSRLTDAAETAYRSYNSEEAMEGMEDGAVIFARGLAWTLADENIYSCQMLYLDEAGQLHVILPIGSLAGAMAYERDLILPLD